MIAPDQHEPATGDWWQTYGWLLAVEEEAMRVAAMARSAAGAMRHPAVGSEPVAGWRVRLRQDTQTLLDLLGEGDQ